MAALISLVILNLFYDRNSCDLIIRDNSLIKLVDQSFESFQEYPDYYEVIKKPIDMEKIGHKVKAGQYDTLEELISDLVLMFDNACRYNEPDSQIYKVPNSSAMYFYANQYPI